MAQLINHLESVIKREVTRIHKSSFGKGPNDTKVKVFDNVVFVRFDGSLSPIEQRLMKSEEGKGLVDKIRNELIINQSSAYIPIIEKIVKEKVDRVSYIFGKECESIYITFLFE